MKLVITGTGRSGTGWAAATLNSAGIYTGHERVFYPHKGLIDWQGYHADCSWLAVPYLPMMGVRAALVVREPLLVVSSMIHIGFGLGDHANQHAQVARQAGMTPDPDGYLRFWVTWNTRALPAVEAVFTFDQLLANPMTLTRWAGAKREPSEVGYVNDRPEWKIGHRPAVSWGMFTDTEAVSQAQQFWDSLKVPA